MGLIDHTHAALAELRNDLIRTELGSGRQCHEKGEYIAGPGYRGLAYNS